MKTIYKYQLEIEDRFKLRIHRGARLLYVGVQHDIACLWAIVDPEAETCIRTLLIRGTGHDAVGLDELPHVGTVILAGGNLVFHIFDKGES